MRSLTPAQELLQQKYTEVHSVPGGEHRAYFTTRSQAFAISPGMDTEQEARWFTEQFAIALSRVLEAEAEQKP